MSSPEVAGARYSGEACLVRLGSDVRDHPTLSISKQERPWPAFRGRGKVFLILDDHDLPTGAEWPSSIPLSLHRSYDAGRMIPATRRLIVDGNFLTIGKCLP